MAIEYGAYGGSRCMCRCHQAKVPTLDEIEVVMDKMEDDIVTSKESLDYWIGIGECNCHAQYPTGGCQQCDLISIRDLLNRLE